MGEQDSDSQGGVPGHNSCACADRLTSRVSRALGYLQELALNLVGPISKVAQGRRGLRHVQVPRLGEEDPGVEGFQEGEVVRVPLHEVRQPAQKPGAFQGGRLLPAISKCGLGGAHSQVNILFLGCGYDGELLRGEGVLDTQCLTARGFHEVVVDEKPGFDFCSIRSPISA